MLTKNPPYLSNESAIIYELIRAYLTKNFYAVIASL